MTEGVTVGVLYTCHGCGIKDRTVQIQERGAEEDVVHWVHEARRIVELDHRLMTPRCPSLEVDLKIPMKNTEARIGEAIRQ